MPGLCRAVRRALPLVLVLLPATRAAERLTPQAIQEEAVLFTAPGFERVGDPKWVGQPASLIEGQAAQLEIVVREAATGRITPCRINVVGPDGDFYQPPANAYSRFALTGVYSQWGKAWGNRLGLAPFRYVGRFFYTNGETSLRVPAGVVRIEVWKGLEFRPESVRVQIAAGQSRRVEVNLAHAVSMAGAGYHPGDLHLHFVRDREETDQMLFDLIEAEGLRYAFMLAPNRPAGPYTGSMDTQAVPQRLGLGRQSIRTRGGYHLMSGQEYRSTTYGHLKLLMLDELVFPGKSFNADNGPCYGEIGREALARGGFAVQAHGGYGQEVYADAALGTISAVELLQFGVYRGMGLPDWYHVLNTGYRFAAEASSDYPACRTMADSRTYVYHAGTPTAPEWLAGLAAGRSFFTTGPLLLIEVDGQKPGAQIRKQGDGVQTVTVRVRVRCEVTPVTDLDLIVNGKIAKRLKLGRGEGQGRWFELEHTVELKESAWIAARAHSKSLGGQPDAEAHTNPVYVYLRDRAPFQAAALDAWMAKIDGQMAIHSRRNFPEREKVVAYFQLARRVLLKIRALGGLSADTEPARLAAELDGVAP